MKCSKRVILGPYKETYCDLEVKHVGVCKTSIIAVSQPKQCPSRNPEGVPCGLPQGHFGQHQNGLRVKPWTCVAKTTGS